MLRFLVLKTFNNDLIQHAVSSVFPIKKKLKMKQHWRFIIAVNTSAQGSALQISTKGGFRHEIEQYIER
jgi:hypothetical protein